MDLSHLACTCLHFHAQRDCRESPDSHAVAKALVPMLCVGTHTSNPLNIQRYAFPRKAWERGKTDIKKPWR